MSDRMGSGMRAGLVCALMVLLSAGSASAVIVDFDAQPVGPLVGPNLPYTEDGYDLVSTSGMFVVDLLNNGNRLVEPASGGTIFTLTESTNLPFGIFTVDVAGGPTNGSQITFTGYLQGGGTVTSNVTLTGNPASFIHVLNWMPGNGQTLTSMTVMFPPGVVGATDIYEVTTVVPEPASLGLIIPAALLALRRKRSVAITSR